jgi:hypothetical protein
MPIVVGTAEYAATFAAASLSAGAASEAIGAASEAAGAAAEAAAASLVAGLELVELHADKSSPVVSTRPSPATRSPVDRVVTCCLLVNLRGG